MLRNNLVMYNRNQSITLNLFNQLINQSRRNLKMMSQAPRTRYTQNTYWKNTFEVDRTTTTTATG